MLQECMNYNYNYIEWTKLFEKENHSSTSWWFYIIETMNFETIYQIMNL